MTVDSLVRGWVRIYTVGLEVEARRLRAGEIESDLWEHRSYAAFDRQRPGATSRSILGRCLAGIPSDLSWRATTNRKELTVSNFFTRNWWQLLASLVAAFSVTVGIDQFQSDDVASGVTPGKIGGLVLFVGGGVLIVAGLLILRRARRRGAALVLVGLLPVALTGGFGLGLIAGLVMSIAGGEGWWWLPLGVASALAFAAALGAFGVWRQAVPNAEGRRMVAPFAVIALGLLGMFAGAWSRPYPNRNRWGRGRTRRIDPADRAAPYQLADEVGNPWVGRVLDQLLVAPHLDDPALVDQGDLVGDHPGLVVVMGDVDHRALIGAEAVAHFLHQPLPQSAVERPDRLIEHD